tara:strand:+ start:468 stop:1073 length:606 start_codon:yes stop_codon:yes gene_type:complete
MIFGRKDFIGIYDNALSSKQCKEIIDYFETQEPHRGGVGNNQKDDGNFYVRIDLKAKDSWDLSVNLDNETIADKHISSALDEYTPRYREDNPEVDWIHSWMAFPRYNLQKYEPGGGYHSYHCENDGSYKDIGYRSDRMMVWMFYLNTVTDQGGTFFHNYNKVMKAREGRLMIWPAFWTHYHKGVMSKTQTKYIATGWYSYT